MPERTIISVDPGASDADSAVVVAKVRDGVVHVERVASLEEIRAWVLSVAERMKPVFDAMRAEFEAMCTAIRPVIQLLAELHEQYPDPADWVIEPEPEGCHHLCGRDHECMGEATTTFVHPRGGGHEIPMCAVCRACAVDACIRMGVVSRAEYLELIGADIQPDPSGQFDGLLASLDRAVYPSPTRAEYNAGAGQLDWGDPLTEADANWPAQGRVCAHVCGGNPDHQCDARATEQLTYALPSGGTRSMPICAACNASETAAKENAHV